MPLCPCGHNKPYEACCQKVHHNHSMAELPEQLMRARYSAHILKLVDFIIDTYHPSCHAENKRSAIATHTTLKWQRLQIIAAPKPDQKNEKNQEVGYVEFKAYYSSENSEQHHIGEQHYINEQHCMHERSRFLKQDGLWYYIDGTFPSEASQKVGRNDSCPCGSQKKYKKCCGN